MSPEKNKRHALKRTLLKAGKLPLIYVGIGLFLSALSYIDDAITPLTRWKTLFDITDKVGSIFFVFAALTFCYRFLIILCRRYEKKLSVNHKVASIILQSIRKSLRIIYILLTIDIIITLAEPSKFYLIFANNLINTIIIISIGWVAIQILYTIETGLYHYSQSLTKHEHIRAKALYSKMHIIRNIATVMIIIITIAVILMSFNSVRNIGISLLASAGFLTAIIGLSAQKTLFSLFSGLQIVISQPIKIGDIVLIEKESGLVEEITFTYVTLKLGDRRRMIIPINYFIEKPFENWSRESNSLRSSLHFNVDFMMPIDPLRAELDNILKSSPYWDGEAQKLQIANLNDRSVEIRVQVSAANADDLSDLRAEVREKILRFIQTSYPDHFPNMRLNGPQGATS